MTKEKGAFLTPKAISNRIKSKGLQRLRWYCQMCQKQCRDESHHRQMKLFSEDGGKFVSSFSSEFLKGYLDILRRQFGGKRMHSNVVYQEYIKDKEHIHMNATKWHSLTGLCLWLGKQGICKTDENEKGWYVEYIDRDPEKMKQQESSDRLEKTEDEIEYNLSKLDSLEVPKYTPLVREDEEKPIRLDISLGQKSTESLSDNQKDESNSQCDGESKVTTHSLINFGVKKEKPVNPLLLADKKAREEKNKQTNKEPKSEIRLGIAGVRRRALDELMEKEEVLKDKRNRRDNWMIEGIEVKLVNRKLPDDLRLNHVAVVKLLDKYTAIVQVIGSSTKIKIDQNHVQTIIPPLSSTILVVNGAYRGEYATLEHVDKEKHVCEITLVTGLCMGRLVKRVFLDDICKLAEVAGK